MSSATVARANVGRFGIGRTMVTSGAHAELPGQTILDCFRRHTNGDFGAVCAEDFEANLDAIAEGSRILSVYHCENREGAKTKVYVITEADRSATTLLLADEY
jgi:hypothetical protein